jgi:TIR domain
MSSLADAPDLVGFFSYSREDDEGSGGKLSKLRERIQEELRLQLGRTRKDFRLWQDKVAIAHGELWEDRIKKAVSESVFFIPIITPTAVRSSYCKFEFESFLAREKELDRNNLIFPILYVQVPALTDDRWRQDPLLAIIGSRQYEQWQNLRQLDPSSTEVALRVETFCANICRALEQEWLSPEERREAEARRIAEDERRRQEAITRFDNTTLRLAEAEAEKRRQDEERQRLELEAEAKRRADEEERTREEPEAQRQGGEGSERWIAFVEAPEPENAVQPLTEPVQIYVSYRLLDDENPPDCPNDHGFVSYLLRQLRYDLRQLGVPDVVRWRGREKLKVGDVWTDAIELNQAELYIVILSTNYSKSDWCNHVLQTIARRVEMLGAPVGQGRILRVDKHKVPEHDIPEPLRRIHAVRFYSEDAENNRVDEYFWRGKVRRPSEYEDAVHALALAIRNRLDELGKIQGMMRSDG